MSQSPAGFSTEPTCPVLLSKTQMIRLAEPLPSDDGPYPGARDRGRFDAELRVERWYDPTLGVWLNEEPIAFAARHEQHRPDDVATQIVDELEAMLVNCSTFQDPPAERSADRLQHGL